MGYVIADEDIVYESGVYYEIIKFISGEAIYLDDPDIEFGPILRNEKSLTFKEKYQSRIEEIDRLLTNKNIPENKVKKLNLEKERIRAVL